MTESHCTSADFETCFNAGKTQLVWHWIASDLETPVSAYLKLAGNTAHSFLLESVEGGAVLGRYSIIGLDPDKIIKDADIETIQSAIRSCAIDHAPGDLPPMAVSGLFGYLGYDNIRLVENIPDKNPDSLNVPRSVLIRPRILVIFDNVRSQICLVTPVYNHTKNSLEKAAAVFASAQERLNACIEKLKNPLDHTALAKKSGITLPLFPSSSMDKSAFAAAVNKAKDYIVAGDIFQVVLSRRFETPFDLPPFQLYRALRRINPSPFMFFLNLDGFSLVGSSPEILVRVRDNIVTIRPIAGTRPRGTTPAEDRALAAELLADPKERAEHLMLLDLGRNDVGRIAEFGSVTVTEQFMIEYYSHVMHIVSNVEGRLKDGHDIVQALFSGFPAGTVSGAPKVRAMEIIDELEPVKRSYYGGGIGYFSGNSTLDTCIALRTALVKDGKLYAQAGAGIVADSHPESEYDETENKARAILRAAELAITESR